LCFWRARTSTSVPAPAPATTPAAATRAQRRGLRTTVGSNSAISTSAASVSSVRRRSKRAVMSRGGSTGLRA
jgi:hypothetical protein